MRNSKIKILLMLTLVVLLLNACMVFKSSKDKNTIKYIRNNTEFIKECAAFSIAFTLDKKVKAFNSSDIKDVKLRNKIASLGNSIKVTYEKDINSNEIPDSIVSFKSILLLGVFEVIYDFASRERTFPGNVSNKIDYYFIKAADRIYYRRSHVPMM